MIFSSVLKIRAESYLKKVEHAIGVAVAIVDESGEVRVASESFDEKWLSENGTLVFEKVSCQDCDLQLVSAPLAPELDRVRLKKMSELIRENIEFLINQEQEAQGLAQEILEKYEELNLLYDLISELSLLFDENKICELTLKKAMRVIDASSGAIFLQNSESNELKLTFHADREDVQKLQYPESLIAFAERAIKEKKEILLDEVGYFPKSYFDNLENKGLWSLLAIPILAHEKIMGSLVLIGKLGDDTFSSGDVKLAEAIAGYAGITINSNRLVEQMRIAEALRHEIKLARKIQQSLLPQSLPRTDFFEAEGICEPAADVGGDYFSVNQVSESKWEFIIADVSGHGIGAALTMASLRSILRSESRLRSNVNEIIENANMLFAQDTEETGMYATLFIARFDAEENRLTYTNAGHLAPLLWRNSKKQFETLTEGGLPVGMFGDESYVQKIVQLDRNDALIMFTDGVTEARNENGEQFGEDRLKMVLKENVNRPASDILAKLLEAVREFSNSDLQRDDITVVVVKGK